MVMTNIILYIGVHVVFQFFPLALLFLNWFKVFKLMWNFRTSLKLNMLKSAIDSGNIKQNSEIIWQMFFKGHCDLQVCGSRCTFSLSLSERRYFQKKLYSTEFISALGLLWKIVYIQFMYAQAETTYKALIP